MQWLSYKYKCLHLFVILTFFEWVWITTTFVCTQNQERLQSFLIWATTTALQSKSLQRLGSTESQFLRNNLREDFQENSVVSTFLRWLIASVIIGKLHKKSYNWDSEYAETHNLESLHSLLVHVKNTSGQRNDIDIGAEEVLASTIFHLQLRLGVNHEVLPSVVCALCLLMFGASKFAGMLIHLIMVYWMQLSTLLLLASYLCFLFHSIVSRTDLLKDYNALIASHSSRVQCPPEANPTWRW